MLAAESGDAAARHGNKIMKLPHLVLAVSFAAFAVSCDVQSGITKKSVEKYEPTPTPERVIVTEEPIDPADVETVSTTEPGPSVNINTEKDAAAANCSKYNNVMVNGNGREAAIKGNCNRIMINGDGNKITVGSVAEIVFNGHDNSVSYTKYSNAKRPIVNDNGSGNSAEKAETPETAAAK